MGWWARRSKNTKRRLVVYPTLVLLIAGFFVYAVAMPGKSHHGPLAPLTPAGEAVAARLRSDVVALAGPGARSQHRTGSLVRSSSQPRQLRAQVESLEIRDHAAGKYAVRLDRESLLVDGATGATVSLGVGSTDAALNDRGTAVLGIDACKIGTADGISVTRLDLGARPELVPCHTRALSGLGDELSVIPRSDYMLYSHVTATLGGRNIYQAMLIKP